MYQKNVTYINKYILQIHLQKDYYLPFLSEFSWNRQIENKERK